MTLLLKSLNGGGSGKEPYTEGEKNLAHCVVSSVLTFGEFPHPKPKTDGVVSEILELIKHDHTGIDTFCRDLFRSVVRATCRSGEDFKSTEDFPKERDPTSIQLLMRVGLERCGRSDMKDEVFKRYGCYKKKG